MKRNIYCLMAAFFTVSLCLGFTSCDDDDDNGGKSTISTDGKIIGKLQIVEYYWNEETDEGGYKLKGNVTDEIDEIEFMISYDEDEYYSTYCSMGKYKVSNGSFSASLGTPSSKYLCPFEETPEGIVISDKLARSISICGIKPLKEGDMVGPYISFQTLDESVWAQFVYVDRNVSINGSFKESRYGYNGDKLIMPTDIEIPSEDQIIYIYEYKAQLKKGWNTLVTTRKKDNNKKTVTWKFTANNAPSNLIWFTGLYGDEFRNNEAKSPSVRSIFK